MDSHDNPVLRAIRERRSIRKFTTDPVDKQTLKTILEAGQWAPSGMNNQPWRFLVITRGDPRVEKLAQCTKYSPLVSSSAACICVFLDKETIYSEIKDHQGAGACIQNMLLAIHTLGLGGVWLGQIINDQSAALSSLGLSEDKLELQAVVVLGHPDQKGGSKRKPLSELMLEDF
ncbi:nitroreductase [uncultured Pseudodesulfovibrio sp.]|uniref:nitroreductase family protein n=1 Tax=uncultured Pseudodesulfovibrio sp. TaxID=2035858 RepID=UPI0029C703F1|nr:nitroreductase [uncultured Pseudodesulfovibrio sp.]